MNRVEDWTMTQKNLLRLLPFGSDRVGRVFAQSQSSTDQYDEIRLNSQVF